MKRTNLKVRCQDGTTSVVRTVFENDGLHFIKADGAYRPIRRTERGVFKSWWYNRVEYITD